MQVRPLLDFKIDIKQYEKIDQIGFGQYGDVYRVSKTKNKKKVFAAKVIKCGNSEDIRNKVIDTEIRIMCSIKHPTIVKIIGYSDTDIFGNENATVIMEYAKNKTLYDTLKKCRNSLGETDFSETTRQIILIGIARGMKYLHDHNIYHCDLKSSNILLDEEFRPLITDFGLARIIEFGVTSRISTSRAIGTWPYLAPESIELNKISSKIDVYAFGILMFEVVTNQDPYPDLSSGKISEYQFKKDIVDNHRRPIYERPNSIKPSIKNLIKQCWSQKAEERPDFEDIFKKLSGELNNDIKDDEDNYFLDNIDVEEVKCYVEDISVVEDSIEALLNKIKELKNENEELKNDIKSIKSDNQEKDNLILKLQKESQANVKKIQDQTKKIEDNQINNDILIQNQTFSSFNLLPLKLQIMISSQIKGKQFIKKVNEFLLYISEKSPKESTNLISIENQNQKNDQLLRENGENGSIHILSNLTEILNRSGLLESNDFINQLKKFESFSIELKYPSDSFDKIYESVSKIKKSHFDDQNRFKICIKIFSIKPNDHRFYNDKSMNVLILSDSVSTLKSDTDSGLFEGCTSLSQISIPSSVTFIGKSTFKGCSSLTRISIPSSVEKIEEFAFSGCNLLSEINVPSTIKDMSDQVFDGCLSVTFSNEMFSIPDRCLSKSLSLIEIFIPSSVKEIRAGAFKGCKSLTHVYIPSSVESIGFYAFDGCSSLEHVFLPDSVSELGNFVLNGCIALKKCRLPSNIKEIGAFLFGGCVVLTEIEIPSKVKSIGNFAFSGCSAIEKVEIPESVESIGNFAFSECSGLKSVSIKSPAIDVDSEAFDGCSSLIEVMISESSGVDKNCFPSSAKIMYT